MLRNIKIINAKLPGYREHQMITLNHQGIIADIQSMDINFSLQENPDSYDVKGDWISRGGVDLQINGGLGLAFVDLQEDHISTLHKICQFLWEEGIDSFLPTIVTTSVENIQRSLCVIDKFMEIQQQELQETAQILGVHLEGPFLNHEKRSASRPISFNPLSRSRRMVARRLWSCRQNHDLGP